jgi:predicted carbohydrate-binding protein with CBM5 and CBM33 domain
VFRRPVPVLAAGRTAQRQLARHPGQLREPHLQLDLHRAAPHRTAQFRYYITRNGWNPNSPLTRAQLDPQPFLTVPMGGRQPNFTEHHQGTIPSGKSGRHLILAVWDVYDTANAFYACSDVQF